MVANRADACQCRYWRTAPSMAKPIKLVPEIQPAPLEVTDHQIVAGTRRHGSADFLLKRLLPPFEITR